MNDDILLAKLKAELAVLKREKRKAAKAEAQRCIFGYPSWVDFL